MVAAGAMTMPAMNGMSFGGGSGASDGFQAQDDGGQPPWYARFGSWLWSFVPMGTTPEHGQATPPNELPDLLAIEEESSQLRTNAQLAGNIDPTNTMRAVARRRPRDADEGKRGTNI